MNDRHSSIAGTRMLIIGASSGIGQALARAAHSRGAEVALAARRLHLLSELADQLGGSAYELDVADPRAVESVINDVAADFGTLDAVIFTSAVVPFALINETDVETWMHSYAVNAVGASHVLRTVLPHLNDNAAIVIASSHDVGRPRAGVAAYHASKAALDEILRSWRAEHPDRAVIRVSVGPTKDTEILRGADRDMLADLHRSWAQEARFRATCPASPTSPTRCCPSSRCRVRIRRWSVRSSTLHRASVRASRDSKGWKGQLDGAWFRRRDSSRHRR